MPTVFNSTHTCRKVIGNVSSAEGGDDDVDNERQRVISGDADSECLRLVNLTKVFYLLNTKSLFPKRKYYYTLRIYIYIHLARVWKENCAFNG